MPAVSFTITTDDKQMHAVSLMQDKPGDTVIHAVLDGTQKHDIVDCSCDVESDTEATFEGDLKVFVFDDHVAISILDSTVTIDISGYNETLHGTVPANVAASIIAFLRACDLP